MAGYCENHPSTIEVRGWTVIVVAIVLASLATAVVAARTWLRLRVQRNVDSSDWMMLVALFFTVAYTIEVCIAYKLDGFDHHMCDLLPEQVIVLRKHTFSVTQLALVSSCTIKVSILLFYRRIMQSHPSKMFLYTNTAVLTFLILQFLAAEITMYASCIPLQAFWRSFDPEWTQNNHFECFNQGIFIITFSAINVLLDLIVTMMPTAMIWHMHLPRIQKIALWVLFSIGLLSTAAAVMRMYYGYVDFLTEEGQSDFAWHLYGTSFWTIIELPCAIICASAPMLKLLFRRFFIDRISLDSPEQGNTRYHYQYQSGMKLSSTSKFLTTSTLEENVIELENGVIVEELFNAGPELSRLKANSRACRQYRVHNSGPLMHSRPAIIEQTPQRDVKADSVSTNATKTTTTTTTTETRHGVATPVELTMPCVEGAWDEASELEMTKLLVAAQKLKGSR